MRLWLQKQWRENQLKWAVFISIVFLGMVILPLILIAHYNYPCSDDFAYADSIYWNIRNGKGLFVIIQGAWEEAMRFYRDWQGRYFDDIVSAFGFGTAVPSFYFLGTYLVLMLFTASNISFIRMITHRICKWKSETAWIFAIIVTGFQLLYVPYAVEAFYWYVGATGYTMTYALLLFLCEALAAFYMAETGKRRILLGFLAVILTMMIGGTNYAVALLTGEILVLALIFMAAKKKRCLFLAAVLAEYTVCFMLNALSPGNRSRLDNVESLGVWGSIGASLQRGAIFVKEWFRAPVILLVIFLVLLCARQISKMEYSFPLPLLVTGISFGLFSSVLTPPFFAGGTWGPGRLINVLYYCYYLFLLGNVLYWLGWITHRQGRLKRFFEENRICRSTEQCVLPMMLLLAVSLLCCLKVNGLQSTNSTSAFLSLVKGEAKQYLIENEERWALFSDEEITDVEVPEFFVKPYVLYHDDIVEDETDWRNITVAGFFRKNSVRLRKD